MLRPYVFAHTPDIGMPYDPDKHHRRSLRLPVYDYAQVGAYFVTLCTAGRTCLLNQIDAGTLDLSTYGHIVERCWCALPQHFPNVSLDAFVVMPNHLHRILILFPVRRIIVDILANTVQFVGIPHDVFIIVALPHRFTPHSTRLIDFARRDRFEILYHSAQRSGLRAMRPGQARMWRVWMLECLPGEDENAMQVVGHYKKSVETNVGEVQG